MKVKELIRMLNDAGYEADPARGKGGHILFRKPGIPGFINVPASHKSLDISPGLLGSVDIQRIQMTVAAR